MAAAGDTMSVTELRGGAAVTAGGVASCGCVLGVRIEMASPDSSLFWSFFALNLVMLLLSYLPCLRRF